MSLARAIGALLFGIAGGIIAGRFTEHILDRFKNNSSKLADSLENRNRDISLFRLWWKTYCHMGWFVIKYVLLGICIAAIIKELVPMRWVLAALGEQQRFGVVIGSLNGHSTLRLWRGYNSIHSGIDEHGDVTRLSPGFFSLRPGYESTNACSYAINYGK